MLKGVLQLPIATCKKNIYYVFLTSNQFGLIKNRQENIWMEETHLHSSLLHHVRVREEHDRALS